jgi:Trk K+ transport system NAD-binding subunit
VLSYAWLGLEQIFALVRGRPLMLLGEHVELFAEPVPDSLDGTTLTDSRIGDATGLNVIGIERDGRLETNPPGSTALHGGWNLVMVGSPAHLEAFRRQFGRA